MKLTMIQSLNRALGVALESDPRVVLMGEDIGRDGGVFRVTEGLFEKFGGDRVIDSPLAESSLIAAAIGMSALGLKPVVEIQFLGFIYPGFNQILSHVARLRNRTRGRFTAPLVIRTPYGGGVRALEHHSESTEALFCHIPGLTVVVPSTPAEAAGLLLASIRGDDPVLFLEPARLYRAEREDVPDILEEIPLRQTRIVRTGTEITLIGWGAMVPAMEKAADASERSVEILDLRTLAPMDRDSILASVRKTGRAVVVHEAPKTGGLGAEISALIAENALLSLNAPVVRVAAPDITVPLPKTEDFYYINPDRILHGLRAVMEF
ncbi:MAG: alpha-ketoacid dehydrogenase subunit beta [Candidatus Aminicenantales bacterium]